MCSILKSFGITENVNQNSTDIPLLTYRNGKSIQKIYSTLLASLWRNRKANKRQVGV